ncbi:hypothetical protein P0136_07915 [Lentisphaerota bacterium ZTH]|nr:hypothetical protein JYG24_00975 [Lentisphaerota bacterium]WET05291.1 hypothetical protein P0136_07915 [Lentisphaerota bacterium ZTH]
MRLKFDKLLLVPLLLVLCSCSSLKISESTSERMIAIKSDGAPALYSIVKPSGDVLSKSDYDYDQQLKSIMRGIKDSGRKKILIFVFGGMNSLDSTVERTENLSKIIYKESDYYPIFINWESSLADSYFDHLLFIRRGVKSYTFGPVLFPFYLVVDIARAVTRLPINLVFQSYGIFMGNTNTDEINGVDAERIRKLKIKYYVGEDYEPDYYPALRRFVYLLGFPVRVVTTALIDVAGKSAWDVMMRRSRIVFQRSQPFEADFSDEVNALTSPPDGALSIFMDRLVKFYKANPEYEFTLIGHSMGPFIINGILSRYDMLPYKNIVYMAPACSCEETAQALRPYLEKHPESTFYNLCIHPHMDASEMMFWAVLPRGSVLRWIDLYLADPLTSNDHCLGVWLNAMYSMPRLLGKVQKQCVIKAFGLYDPVTNTARLNMPQKHTDFSDPVLRFWEPKFWQIPQNKISPQSCPFIDRVGSYRRLESKYKK